MSDEDQLSARLARADERRQRARRERGASLWTQIARVGTLGWMIALPIVGGALLGRWMDRWLGTGITWALGLMALGVAVAGYGLWSELRRKS